MFCTYSFVFVNKFFVNNCIVINLENYYELVVLITLTVLLIKLILTTLLFVKLIKVEKFYLKTGPNVLT